MTTVFRLVPFTRVGPIDAGMSFSAVESMYGPQCRPFRRNQFSASEGLIVDDNHFVVSFTEARLCSGVEFYVGKGNSLTFQGVELLAESNAALKEALQSVGEEVEASDYGIRCARIGIATYHPEFGDDGYQDPMDCPIDALYVSLDRSYVP